MLRRVGSSVTQDGGASLESHLGARLGRWVMAMARGRLWVALGAIAVFAASLFYTITTLGIRSETEALFPEDLPFRVLDARFLDTFPMLHENIVLVVEGPSAEGTRVATLRLAERLASQPELFPRVYVPADPFFERNGLLYMEVDELDELADRLAQLQPLLAGLVEDASLRGLMDQTRGAVEALRRERIAEIDLAPILERLEEVVRTTLVTSDEGDGVRLDWSAIIDWGQSDGNPRRRVIQIQPAVDYGSMSAARESILRLRDLVRTEGFATTGDAGHDGYRVRMTGDIVLNFDEMSLLGEQVAGAGVGSFVVVALLLFAALRSGRLVLATVTSLLFGLVVTAGFATLAIGHLNMISVAFAVLFIGLGVDFGIHLCMRFHELRVGGAATEEALLESARGVGSSLMLCAVTTAVGFFAFVPTEFTGVAELGVIAGFGMFIGVASSFTIIPAILAGASGSSAEGSAIPTLRLPTWPVHHARAVVVGCLVLAVAGLALLPELYFDQNPLNVRDPGAESVQVYADLLADSSRSPWTLEYLADTAKEADAIALRFEALPEVDTARTLSDFLPTDQNAKLEVIEEMAYFVDWSAIKPLPPPAPAESIESLAALREELARASDRGLDPAVARAAASLEASLSAVLDRVSAAAPEDRARRIADLDARLLGNFPGLLARLERAMGAGRVGEDDVPLAVREARVSREGLHRVEIVPAADLTLPGELDRFVSAGRAVTEDLAGPSIRIQSSADAVVGALIQALGAAVVVILLFLFVLWRRPGDVALVMLPLLFAGISTGASMVILDIPFNFADVIVLPLLLGIGVDSGIHMVHRARIREDASEALLSTSTARAVVFSATTTIASFGTLAIVPHQGMANLGQLLVIGVGWTVLANLVLLPALLELRERRLS